jgi:sec-independent protein translocase protein TatB
MFDVSLSELLVIAVIGVLVIGPKELPVVMRSVMRAVRQLKSFAKQFTDQFTQMVDESELKEFREEMREEVRYIRDAEGKLYESYDISDFLAEEEIRVKGKLNEPR